jgi:ATP-dependent DNA ligase
LSRTRKLSQETPALYLAFDLLTTAADKKLFARPLRKRRPALEAFAKSRFKSNPTFRLSPATTSYATARKWPAQAGGGCDGVS